MKTTIILLISLTTFFKINAQDIDCPNVYLYAYQFECPSGPSLGLSVHYPLQTEFVLKLIRTSTGNIVEEFTVTDPEGTNNSSFTHYFGVLEPGNWTVTINSYEYYWGGELICEETKQIELLTCESLNIQNNLLESMEYFPNPIENELFIKLPSGYSSNQINISMHNTAGAKIMDFKTIPINNTFKIDNLNKLSKGIYLLQIETNKGSIAKKIIIN